MHVHLVIVGSDIESIGDAETDVSTKYAMHPPCV